MFECNENKKYICIDNRKKKLGLPGIDLEAVQEKNALMAGEFEVIIELLGAYTEGDQAKIAKAQVN